MAAPAPPFQNGLANGVSPQMSNGNPVAGPSSPPRQGEQPSQDDVKPGETEQDIEHAFAARREEEMARRDRSLTELLVMLDGYKPLVRPADWKLMLS